MDVCGIRLGLVLTREGPVHLLLASSLVWSISVVNLCRGFDPRDSSGDFPHEHWDIYTLRLISLVLI